MSDFFTQEEKDFLDDIEHRHGSEARCDAEAEITKLRNAFKQVLGSEHGRTVLWWLMSGCGIFTSTMTGNAWSNYYEGRRAVGLETMSQIIAADSKLWLEMQSENLLDMQKDLQSSPRSKRNG